MTALLLAPPRTCAPWCVRHNFDSDVCSTDVVHLDFDTTVPGVIFDANVALASSADGTSVMVGMDGTGYALAVDAAEELALAILVKVAAARNHTVPIAKGDHVTWTSKWNGHTQSGIVDGIIPWRGHFSARVEGVTDDGLRVVTHIDVAKLKRTNPSRIPTQRTDGGAA